MVDILDVGVWCERAFIVMELLNGCDLDTYLDEYGTLSNREIASLALPVIAGVMAVHDAGVIHRDLKPSNIFLSKGPEVPAHRPERDPRVPGGPTGAARR